MALERGQSERMGYHLELLAQQSREALRKGQRPSTTNEAEALRRALEQRRGRLEEELEELFVFCIKENANSAGSVRSVV